MIELDGTPNKGRLGANALLGVSMALARANAAAAGVPLYAHVGAPLRQSGGRHGPAGADDEHPQRRRARRQQRRLPGIHGHAASARRRSPRRVRCGAEIFHTLRGILKKKGHSTGVGDEGGFAPSLSSNQEARRRRARSGRAGRVQAGREGVSRARRRVERVVERRRQDLRVQEVRGQDPHRRRDGRAVRGLGPAVSDHLDRRRPRRRRLGRLEGADQRARRRACSWSATTCSSPTPRSCGAASARTSATRCSSS